MARRKKDDLGTPQLGGSLDIKISEMAGAKGFGGGSTGGKGFFKAKPRKSNDTSWFKGTKKGKEALKIRMKESEQGRKIANSSVPRTSSAKDKLWQPGENIPTPFDISKTKPGSRQRASVIKASKEADVNKQGHVIIGGKGVNRSDVPQHKAILRERQSYKSKKMQEHKSKPEYKAKKEAENKAALDSAKGQTVTLKPFSAKQNEASRVSKMSSKAKTKYYKRMKKIDRQLPF